MGRIDSPKTKDLMDSDLEVVANKQSPKLSLEKNVKGVEGEKNVAIGFIHSFEPAGLSSNLLIEKSLSFMSESTKLKDL